MRSTALALFVSLATACAAVRPQVVTTKTVWCGRTRHGVVCEYTPGECKRFGGHGCAPNVGDAVPFMRGRRF